MKICLRDGASLQYILLMNRAAVCFVAVPWVDLQSVIMVFSGHTKSLFSQPLHFTLGPYKICVVILNKLPFVCMFV